MKGAKTKKTIKGYTIFDSIMESELLTKKMYMLWLRISYNER